MKEQSENVSENATIPAWNVDLTSQLRSLVEEKDRIKKGLDKMTDKNDELTAKLESIEDDKFQNTNELAAFKAHNSELENSKSEYTHEHKIDAEPRSDTTASIHRDHKNDYITEELQDQLAQHITLQVEATATLKNDATTIDLLYKLNTDATQEISELKEKATDLDTKLEAKDLQNQEDMKTFTEEKEKVVEELIDRSNVIYRLLNQAESLET